MRKFLRDLIITFSIVGTLGFGSINSSASSKFKSNNEVHNVYAIKDAKLMTSKSFKHHKWIYQGDSYQTDGYLIHKHKKYAHVFNNKISGYILSKDLNDVHTTLDSDFDENSITTPEEVANTPWETDYYGKKIIEPLANGRDIYYHIESTNNCADIWQKAIDNWNELGVIKFVPTNSTDDKHVLTLNDTNEPIGGNNNWSGITYNTRTGYYPGELVYNQCSLKTNDMNNAQGYTDYQKVCVAEHELGHVLGFAHDSRTYLNKSVDALMNPVAEEGGTKDFLQLDAGATQQFALAQNYNLSILPGSMPFKELNLKIYRDGNYERLDDSVPNKDVPYDFTTNTFTTVDAHE